MGILLSSVIRAFVYFAGGVGVTSLIDKFVPDKLPAGTYPLSPVTTNPGTPINWMKVILSCVAGAIGIMIIKFVGKKMNIKLLK